MHLLELFKMSYLSDFIFRDSAICIFINPAINFSPHNQQKDEWLATINKKMNDFQQTCKKKKIVIFLTCQRKFEAWNQNSDQRSDPKTLLADP